MSSIELNADERRQLAAAIGSEESSLDANLEAYSKAALEEYVRMILGQRVLTRGQDIREYRLFLIIQQAFPGQLPTEQQISNLFQTTASQSRALLRAVMSKYQYELANVIQQTLADLLGTATKASEGDVWVLTVDSEGVIESLNRLLATIDGTLPHISRRRNSTTSYDIQPSAYDQLQDHFKS